MKYNPVLLLALSFAAAPSHALTYTSPLIASGPDWSMAKTETNSGLVSYGRTTVGGGDHFAVDLDAPSFSPYSVASLTAVYSGVYDPQSQGALNSLSFTINRIDLNTPVFTSTSTPWGRAVGNFLVTQGGISYTSQQYDTTWDTVFDPESLNNLTALDFTDGLGNHPNFSTTGGAMQFGWTLGVSGQSAGSVGLDNFSVTLNQVPAPGVLSLFMAGLVGMMWQGRFASRKAGEPA